MRNSIIKISISSINKINKFEIEKNYLVKKIVSGGQTGVDRAALDVAIKYNLVHGGWCPKGRLAEDNTIPLVYNMQETDSSDYSQRTKQNIIDSDATLILVPKLPLPVSITDGTSLTINTCEDINKLYLIIDLSDNYCLDEVRYWIKQNNVSVINIAGPRESQSNGIYNLAYNYLEKLLFSDINTY